MQNAWTVEIQAWFGNGYTYFEYLDSLYYDVLIEKNNPSK